MGMRVACSIVVVSPSSEGITESEKSLSLKDIMSKTELWWSIFLLQNILLGTSGGGGGGSLIFAKANVA